MEPRVALLPFDHLDGSLRERARHHLQSWLRSHIGAHLSPLNKMFSVEFEGLARGLIFQLREGLGIVSRAQVADMVSGLNGVDRAKLYRLGVRLGYQDVYLQALMRPARLQVRHRLWRLNQPTEEVPELPEPGRVTVDLVSGEGDNLLAACGYRPVGGKAVRVDILDRLSGLAHNAGSSGPFIADHQMMSLLGLDRAGLDKVLTGLGYEGSGELEQRRYKFRHTRKKRGQNLHRRHEPISAAFSDLRQLLKRK